MRKRDQDDFSPDLTPLIDVVFILLVFFIVTSVFKKEELALKLNLTKAKNFGESQSDKKDLIIEVDTAKVFIDKSEVSGEEQILELLKSMDKKRNVIIRGDSKVSYSRIIFILDLLKQSNFSSINLITNKK